MADSFSFQAGRGMLVQISAGSSSSAYSIDGLATGTQSNGAIMLDNIQIGDQDCVGPTDALGDKHVMYVFGPTFKPISIQGTIYLKICGAGGGGNSGGVEAVSGFFSGARVSSSLSSVGVSVGGYKVGMYVTDLTFGQIDAERNTIGFMISGYSRPRK